MDQRGMPIKEQEIEMILARQPQRRIESDYLDVLTHPSPDLIRYQLVLEVRRYRLLHKANPGVVESPIPDILIERQGSPGFLPQQVACRGDIATIESFL